MGNTRPLVSFCLFTYNQEKFVQEAVEGALAQTYTPMEIIISDDCSSDNTQHIISQVIENYSGPHKIVFNKNEKNLGLAAHVNKVLYEISQGDYLALAAGDDISLPDRINLSMEFIHNKPDVMALSTHLITIDERGNQIDDSLFTTESQVFDLDYYLSDKNRHINGPSRIIRRKVLETFPPLSNDCPTEDTTFLLRCYLIGKVALLKDELVKYRRHDNNITAPSNFHTININKIFKQYRDDLDIVMGVINQETIKKVQLQLKRLQKKRLNDIRRLKIILIKKKIKSLLKIR